MFFWYMCEGFWCEVELIYSDLKLGVVLVWVRKNLDYIEFKIKKNVFE